MRLFLSAASMLVLGTVSASASDAPGFDIWQSSDATKTVIAIAAQGDKAPFAAAAGTDKAALDLLAADEASLAIAELRARTAAKIEMAETAVENAAETKGEKKIVEIVKKKHDGHDMTAEEHAAMGHDSHGATAAASEGPHKIVLVKEVKAEGEKAEKKEVRRIIKLNGDAKMTDADIAKAIEEAKAELGADATVEHGALGVDDADAALLASAKGAKVMVVENDKDGAKTRLVSILGADIEGARAFLDKAEGLDDAEKAKIRADLGL